MTTTRSRYVGVRAVGTVRAAGAVGREATRPAVTASPIPVFIDS